jgi:hypothetical protein
MGRVGIEPTTVSVRSRQGGTGVENPVSTNTAFPTETHRLETSGIAQRRGAGAVFGEG